VLARRALATRRNNGLRHLGPRPGTLRRLHYGSIFFLLHLVAHPVCRPERGYTIEHLRRCRERPPENCRQCYRIVFLDKRCAAMNGASSLGARVRTAVRSSGSRAQAVLWPHVREEIPVREQIFEENTTLPAGVPRNQSRATASIKRKTTRQNPRRIFSVPRLLLSIADRLMLAGVV